MSSDLSVIVPSRTLSNLIPCVAAVRQHDPHPRIIWVDDRDEEVKKAPDEDDGSELQQALDHGLWVVRGAKPFCFARNVNLGIRAAGEDDVVVLNDDALLKTPLGFTDMQKVARLKLDYGVIGAVTNVTGQILQHPQNVGLRKVSHFAFVAVLIPRTTIDRVGLLDERYCLDYGVEDRDYCEACRQAGLKAGIYDWCYVDHQSLKSTYRGHPHLARDYSQNKGLFDQKWGAGVWNATA
jgi:GT2 family glycosyltransferase